MTKVILKFTTFILIAFLSFSIEKEKFMNVKTDRTSIKACFILNLLHT